MSIASEITRIENNIALAYTQCELKDATMPAIRNSANLANCIASIIGGGLGHIVIGDLLFFYTGSSISGSSITIDNSSVSGTSINIG